MILKKKYKTYTILVCILSLNLYASLLRPENNDELNYTHILFEWEQFPDVYTYNLQVSKNISFNDLVLDINEPTTVYIDKNSFQWDSNYFCRVRPIYNCSDCDYGEWSDTSNFSIISSYDWDIEIEINNENILEEGYIAIGAFLPSLESVIIDKNGKQIWNDAGFQFQLNHINEYGNIYGFSTVDYPLNTGMKANTEMDVLWSTMDANNPVDTHEIKQLPNGNFMAFIRVEQLGPIPSDNYMTPYFQMIGYQADGITPEFLWYGQKIVEWNDDHEIIWSWDPFDHFTMDDYDNYEGTWYGAYFNQEHDWMHSNAFHFDQNESVIYVSHRHLSRISKIAYPSGEIIWNMGLPAEYMFSGNEHICTELLFSFQHNIQLMDNGDLLFFDNGNLSDMLLGDSNPTTRIRRIKVIDNSFCETVWEYDLPQGLHGLGMGSVQELENGNYSIYTYGSGLNNPECSVIEVTPEKEIIWQATGTNNSAWYRAYKIPQLHPDAFSIMANNYITNDEVSIIETTNTISFTIFNKSAYDLEYSYILSDLMDGGSQLFEYSEGQFSLEPYASTDLVFNIIENTNINETEIMLSVWPNFHEYSVKELQFNIKLNQILGDINQDGIVNILDIVNLINIILGYSEELVYADINEDGICNILDVVNLINIILT